MFIGGSSMVSTLELTSTFLGLTTVEVFSEPHGSIAIIRFGTLNPLLANSISMLIYLL